MHASWYTCDEDGGDSITAHFQLQWRDFDGLFFREFFGNCRLNAWQNSKNWLKIRQGNSNWSFHFEKINMFDNRKCEKIFVKIEEFLEKLKLFLIKSLQGKKCTILIIKKGNKSIKSMEQDKKKSTWKSLLLKPNFMAFWCVPQN